MELKTVVCKNGGILRELYKSGEFGQVSMRILHPGKSSGGAFHLRRDEKWWIISGTALIVLEYPAGKKVRFVEAGPSSRIIEVPAGTGHMISNHGSVDLVWVWHSSEVYDSKNPDRYAWEDE